MVAFACGPGRPAARAEPMRARPAARLTVVVVLPTPPFWLTNAEKIWAMVAYRKAFRTTSPGERQNRSGTGWSACAATARRSLARRRSAKRWTSSDSMKPLQQHQRGRRHRQHAKRDTPCWRTGSMNNGEGKVKNDRLWVEQGDQEPLPKGALPRGRRRQRAALLRAQAPHTGCPARPDRPRHPLQDPRTPWGTRAAAPPRPSAHQIGTWSPASPPGVAAMRRECPPAPCPWQSPGCPGPGPSGTARTRPQRRRNQ